MRSSQAEIFAGEQHPSGIQCRICDGGTVGFPWGGSVCTSCGSISATRLPEPEELAAFYLRFNQTYHGGGRADGAGERQHRYALAYLKPLLKLKTGVRLLDIGSSTNPFPNIATSCGYDVTVIDYVKPEGLSERVGFVEGSIDQENIPAGLSNGEFDVVTAFAVIEHSRSPKLMAAHMVQLCRRNGCLVVATPLVNSFSEKNALGKTPWFYPPEHIHLLSPRGMSTLFTALGCRLIAARRYELNWMRWTLRYGLAFLEGCSGCLAKKLMPNTWKNARNSRTSRVQELMYYVFKKQ